MSVTFDLFCGASGAGTGLVQAAEAVGKPIRELVAVNHWRPAVETTRRNYPWATVLHEDVSRVDPRPLFKGKKVKLGVAGPSCTYHSRARGGRSMKSTVPGKPGGEQERSHAWDVLRWARLVEPENLIIENVPEFEQWGPLHHVHDKNGNPKFEMDGVTPFMAPDPARRGEFFREFLQGLRRLGYKVDYRILCTAHYGDATTRRRLFIQARSGRLSWPEPSHRLREEQADLFDLPIARCAREIIDWNLPGKSIWTRPEPLAAATMARILEGLRRFLGGPFIVPQLSGARVRSLDEPLNTITATGSGNALVEPFLLGIGGPRGRQVVSSIDSPLGTILSQNHTYLAEPFLIPNFGEAAGQRPRTHSIDDPLPTVTGHGAGALVEPFLVSYYGNGKALGIDDPLATITGRDRFALVESLGTALDKGVTVVADIRLRMLQPHELAAAHSFPSHYQFVGSKRDAVKMVGNSWPVATAQALCREVLS